MLSTAIDIDTPQQETKTYSIEQITLQASLARIEVKLDSIDKRLEKLDSRLDRVIWLLLAYPLGLIVGKLCHIY